LSVSDLEAAARMSEALSMVRMNEALSSSSLDALAVARMNEALSARSITFPQTTSFDNVQTSSLPLDSITSTLRGNLEEGSTNGVGQIPAGRNMYDPGINNQQHNQMNMQQIVINSSTSMTTTEEIITPSRMEDALFLARSERISTGTPTSGIEEAARIQEDLAASTLDETVGSSGSAIISTSSLSQDLSTKSSSNNVPPKQIERTDAGNINPHNTSNTLSQPLSIASWKQMSHESYLDFYTRIFNYQLENLLKAGTRVSGGILNQDDIFTKSHQLLLCVIWLERIDHRLPALVQVKFAREFQAGANLIDLVPLLAESIDELMDGIESSPAKLNSSQCYSSDVQIKNEPKTTIKKEVSYNDLDDSFDQSELGYFDASREVGEMETLGLEVDNDPGDIIKLEMPQDEQELPAKEQFQTLEADQERPKKMKKKKKLKFKKKRGRPRDSTSLAKKPLMPLDHDISCDKCDYNTKFVKEFRVHQKEKHNISVRYCKKCDIFVELVNFKKHLASAHRSEPAVCPECSKAFRTDQGLMGHRLKVHNIGEGYMCEFCPYKTVKLTHLQNHMKNHSDCPKPYVCNECGATFSRKDSLQNHVKYRHEGVIYYCDQCSFSTPRGIKSFKLHMNKEHLGLIFAKCDKCGQKFKSRYELRTHMATIHGSGKYFSCPKCDYNATTKQLLQEHDMKVHELIFFRCEMCPSKFVRKYALRRHMENVHKLAGVKVEGQNIG